MCNLGKLMGLVVAAALVACGGDDEEPAGADGGGASSTETSGEQPGLDEDVPPVERLDRLFKTVESASDIDCLPPEPNREPDGMNRYAASGQCTGAAPLTDEPISVYIDDPDPYEGEECSAEDTPFTEVGQVQVANGEFYAALSAIVPPGGDPGDVVRTLHDFVAAAGWDADPTCAPPV